MSVREGGNLYYPLIKFPCHILRPAGLKLKGLVLSAQQKKQKNNNTNPHAEKDIHTETMANRGGEFGRAGKGNTPRWLLIGSFPFQLHSPVPLLCAHSDTWAHVDMRAGHAHTVLGESPSAAPPSCALAVADRKRTSAANEKEGVRAQSATERSKSSKSQSRCDRIVKWNRLICGHIIKHKSLKPRPIKCVSDYTTPENSAALQSKPNSPPSLLGSFLH